MHAGPACPPSPSCQPVVGESGADRSEFVLGKHRVKEDGKEHPQECVKLKVKQYVLKKTTWRILQLIHCIIVSGCIC